MAVHAGLGRRNAGKTRSLHRGVAIPAINTERAHVVLMTEWHRLNLRHSHVVHVWRALNLFTHPGEAKQHKHRTKNREARNAICAAMKDLRHLLDQSSVCS